ncbi:MAG: 1,4-dihydroxy-2-naphthoate polyprenyltransferase [Bacteroidaceae bacterium]|nr:1,4-dihydroxy-2-naphthoate polyprenyltransferase [Bacteroidaceae bacterium]
MYSEVRPNSCKAWMLAARPKTLTGACVPVLVGAALAWHDGYHAIGPASLCFAFACLMQIAANFINDLYDFLRGTDRSDRLGPERACAQGWITPKAMKMGIALVVTAACAVGATVLLWSSPWLIALGAACVLFAFLYTTRLSYMGLGDLLVFVFFGFVPVMGTYFVVSGTLHWESIVCSLSVGCIIDLLLIVNNYRDRDTDRISGKRTLIAHFGETFGNRQYLITGIAGCLFPLLLCITHQGWSILLPLLYLPLHFQTWNKMVRIREGRALNKVLGLTSRNMLIFGILLSVGILLS